jgi:uncharacterized membrane protein YfcA
MPRPSKVSVGRNRVPRRCRESLIFCGRVYDWRRHSASSQFLDTLTLFLFGIILLAALTESVSGFGSALVAMAFLPLLVGIQQAVPLVALVSLILEIVLLLYYRGAINVTAIRRVIFGSLFGIPLGIFWLRGAEERVVLSLLGVVLVSYAAFSLLKLRLPKFARPLWGWVFGFVAGVLGGAYNTSGPPVVVYRQSQDWDPAEFKANLQSFFLVNSALVLLGHALSGNVTPQVWNYFWIALPALALGIALGLAVSRFIDPLRFRQIVQRMLIMLGLRLMFA